MEHGHVNRGLDRSDLGFLPGDVNGDKVTNSADHDRILDHLRGLPYADLNFVDMDRNNAFNVDDKTRLEQLLDGTNSTRA